MYLSVIIPAYNEEKRLPETLKKIKEYLDKQNYECHAERDSNPTQRGWEVLVVNDGSKDKTGKVVSDLIKGWGPPAGGFRLIDNQENQGKGGVVKQGMLEAKGEWRLFMDADNSTDISELEKLWPYTSASSRQHLQTTGSSRPSEASLPTRSASALDRAPRPARVSLEDTVSFQPFEIVIGSRYLNKDSIKVKQPLVRRIVSRFGNWLVRVLLGLDMVDTQCGFKLFSAKAAEDIFPRQTIMRWGFDMEILAIARKKGYKIKEVAVDWYDAEGSQVKKSAALKTLKELLTIKRNLMRGKYS